MLISLYGNLHLINWVYNSTREFEFQYFLQKNELYYVYFDRIWYIICLAGTIILVFLIFLVFYYSILHKNSVLT